MPRTSEDFYPALLAYLDLSQTGSFATVGGSMRFIANGTNTKFHLTGWRGFVLQQWEVDKLREK